LTVFENPKYSSVTGGVMNNLKKAFWFIVLLTVFLLISCGKEEIETEVVRPVRYIRVKPASGIREFTFSGTAQAGLESRLSFRIPGAVQEVAVVVGEHVRAGQLIARLDSEDYQLEVQNAEAQELNAKNNYNRMRQLYENNTTSKNQLDQARAAAESAEAVFKLARQRVGYTRLTAPVSGAIAAVNVEVNENISQGQPIAILTSGSRSEVNVAIPENLITQIKVGDPVKIAFGAVANRTYGGRVTEVGVTTTGMASTFPVTVKLEEDEEDIRPGMSADVTFYFEAPDTENRIIIPLKAVTEDHLGRFVYLVEPEEEGFGLVRRQPVRKGELTAEGIEIVEGVTEGDLLVTAGLSRITNGLRVRLLGDMEEAQ
jgi:RND family efflux transporter MFP subunit